MKNEKAFLNDIVNHLEKDHKPFYKKKENKYTAKGCLWWTAGVLSLVAAVSNLCKASEWHGKGDTLECEVEMLKRRKAKVENNKEQ